MFCRIITKNIVNQVNTKLKISCIWFLGKIVINEKKKLKINFSLSYLWKISKLNIFKIN